MNRILFRCCLVWVCLSSCTFAWAQWDYLKFKQLKTSDGLSQNTIQTIFEDDLGFLWFGTQDGINKYDSYQFHIIRKAPDSEHTLQSNDIKSIVQDRDKQLWIATSDSECPNIFDPVTRQIKRADIYLTGNDTDLSNVISFSTTREGNVLICSRLSGLLIYDHQRKKITSTEVDFSVTCTEQDPQGNLWVGTYQHGVVVTDRNGRIRHRYDALSDGPITDIHVDQSGRVWASSAASGIYYYDAVNDRFSNAHLGFAGKLVGQTKVLCIGEDIDGQIWCGTENEGLHILNLQQQRCINYRPDKQDAQSIASNSINCIRRDRKGNMWIGTSGAGISMVNIDEINILHFRNTGNPHSLNNNIINCLFQDTKGNIWVGTDGGGLNRFDKAENTFSNGRDIPFQQPEAGRYVVSITESDKGELWVGTWGEGIYCYHLGKGGSKRINTANTPQLRSNNINSMLKDRIGRIWIGTYGGGVTRYDPSEDRFQHYGTGKGSDDINSNHILSLFESSDGKIWMGTEGSGIGVYDTETGTFDVITTDSDLAGSPLSNNTVKSFAEDRHGNMWIGTSYGLNKLDYLRKRNDVYFTSNSAIQSDIINAIVTDNYGHIWAATNKGITKIDDRTQAMVNYMPSNGLQGDEFRRVKLVDREGNLYFGGVNGLNVINKSGVKPRNYTPSLVFTNFQLSNVDVPISTPERPTPLLQDINYTETITLDYTQANFSLEFASLNYVNPAQKAYEYKLDGMDKNWLPLGDKNVLSFNNLPPGNYKLLVRGTNNNGSWSDHPANIQIVITPPFWLTWWFKTLVVVLALIAIFSIYYYRLRNIRRQNTLLERKIAEKTTLLYNANNELQATNQEIRNQNTMLAHKNEEISQQQQKIIEQNSRLETVINELETSNQMKDKFLSILVHDLKNPLSALTGLTDLLKENLPHLSRKEIAAYIDDLSLSSNSLSNLVINLLEWGKTKTNKLHFSPKSFNLYDLIQKNIYLFNLQLQGKQIQCSVSVDPGIQLFADYQMVNTIIRNILSNSIKYSHIGGRVGFECITDHEYVHIKIRDNGVGMNDAQIERIFQDKSDSTIGTNGETGTGLGFQICREFIKAHSGELSIQSAKNKGSVFTISLPNVQAKAVNPQRELARPSPTVTESLHKFARVRILVVDDNQSIRSLLRHILENYFEVEEAGDGQGGLDIARKTQPDLIITDLIMPGVDGLSLTKSIKSDITTSHIPVLLLTSEDQEASQLLGYKAGADIYLTKPIHADLLLAVIGNFLNRPKPTPKDLIEETTPVVAELGLSELDKAFMEEVRDFVVTHMAEYDLDYKSLCRQFGMSRSVLYAKFKAITGKGVHDYIKSIRLAEAERLLHEGKLNVSQIAYSVGFNSVSYFSKSFSKQMNVSPKAYQKNTK